MNPPFCPDGGRLDVGGGFVSYRLLCQCFSGAGVVAGSSGVGAVARRLIMAS